MDGERADWRHAFYAETIEALQQVGAATRLLSLLEAAALALPCPDPSLVILHAGRSGSTLLSRALEVASPMAITREPDPLHDALIAAAMAPSEPDRQTLLLQVRIGAGLLVAAARGRGLDLGLKLPTMTTMALTETLSTFPTSPLVFIVRDPVDAARSMARQPPRWISEAAIDLPLGAADPTANGPPEVILTGDEIAIRYAQLWSRMVDDVLAIESRDVHIVLYEDLLNDLAGTLAAILRHARRDDALDRERAVALGVLVHHQAKGLGDEPFVRHRGSPLSIDLEGELRASLESRMTLLRTAAHRTR